MYTVKVVKGTQRAHGQRNLEKWVLILVGLVDGAYFYKPQENHVKPHGKSRTQCFVYNICCHCCALTCQHTRTVRKHHS